MMHQLTFHGYDRPRHSCPPPAVAVLPAAPVVVYLVGCGKTKARTARRAKDLYTGNLFRAARAHAERESTTWRILSARFGLPVNPEMKIAPYDLTLRSYSAFERYQWAHTVVSGLCSDMARAGVAKFEVVCLAGEDYAAPVGAMLEERGIRCTRPLKGLGVGQRLGWFAAARRAEVLQ